MKLISFIILFWSCFLGAESIFDRCDDQDIQNQLESVSLLGKGYELTEKLHQVHCSSQKGQKTLILFNELMTSIPDLSLISDQQDQTLFFVWFVSLYPEILFNLQNNNEVNDLVDVFIEHMNIVEEETIRLGLEDHYSSAINILSMYVRNHMQNPKISIDLINYAERILFASAKESFILEGDSLPIIVYLKINKISSLLLSADYDLTLSEINLFLKLIKPGMAASEFEASLMLDLLNDLGTNVENSLSQSSSISNLKITLFDLIISNKTLDFDEDFMLQLLLFLFKESISAENNSCNENIFLNLLDDKRASDNLKDFISTVCFPSKDKFFGAVNSIFNKHQYDADYRLGFENVVKSLIFSYQEESYTPYSVVDLEEAVLDIAFIFASETSATKSYQIYLDQIFDYCAKPNGTPECMEVYKKINIIKQSFLVDLPEEININNIGNAAIIFVAAEDIFFDDFEGMKKFTHDFFKKHTIIFPTLQEVKKYFDLNSVSNEINIKNFSAIGQFSNLYDASQKYLYKSDAGTNNLFYASIYKEFSEFFMMSANLLYELASKDPFFKSLTSQATKDTILESLHASVIAHQKYEYFSGDYEFLYFPVAALDLIIKVQRNNFDNSLSLDAYSQSNIAPELKNTASNIKNTFSSNFRINNYLTLKKNLTLDEVARLRFDQDENIRTLRDSSQSLSALKETKPKNLALDLMQKLDDDEVLEYHFALPASDKRLIFRINSNYIQLTSYDIFDEDIMEIYKEFSSSQYRGQARESADTLSNSLYEVLSYDEDIKKIYFAVDGVLRFIPFHALEYQDSYLIEKFTVSYLPSLSSFLNFKGNTKPLKFFGIGHPKYNSIKQNLIKTRGFQDQVSFSSLPETQDEIIAISKAFDSQKILLLDEATKENFLSNTMLHKNSMIYFATHSIPFGNSITDEPGLALTPIYNDQSGVLTISEISKNNFSGSIIALSACKTFDASFEDNAAYSGIAQSFFLAGARGVYTTMWDIESFSASVFNKNLFSNYQGNSDIPISMQETARDFISGKLGQEYKDPFYWAPYLYLGK